MKEISVLLSNPRHVDYPWFRSNLKWMSEYFKTVYIALTQDTMPPDITEGLIHAVEYKNVTWARPPRSNGADDWRDLAVKEMLINFPHPEYVLFLEQDFLIKDKNFFEKVLSGLDSYDFIYYREGERIHPAFALVKYEQARSSSMNFAVHPQYDHFYNFFTTLPYTHKAELRELGLVEKVDFYHMAGLSNNYHVYNLKQPFYKPEEFLSYNHLCNKLPIRHISPFYELCQRIETDCGAGDPNSFVKNFFPKDAT